MSQLSKINLSRSTWLLLAILILGSFFRLYRLGQIPAGYTWDEAAITYDAWGIQDWHRDQYANRMPLVFKSFGDYKAPLMHYLLALTFYITGPQEITIRLISAFAGLSLIIITYGISKELFPSNTKVPCISALLVAISPWNIHMSRVGFEANLAVSLTAFSVWMFLLAKKYHFTIYISTLALAGSLYAYQSSKIVVPLLLILFTFYYFKNGYRFKFNTWIPLVISLFVLFTPFYFSLEQGGLERGKQALVIFRDNQLVLNFNTLLQLFLNTLKHLTPSFLYKGVQENQRNLVPGFGILYITELPLLFTGLIMSFRNLRKHILLLTWIAIGLIPSILSVVSPHTLRASGIMPAIHIIEAIGLAAFATYKVKSNKISIIIQMLLVFFVLLNSLVFYRFYLTYYYQSSAPDFQYGYQQAVSAIKEYGKSVDHIVFTDAYQQPYIYTLLYRRITPEEFQAGALANMSFHRINWPSERNNTLFIATPDEIPSNDSSVIDLIYFPNSDSIAFVIARTK